MTTKIRLLAIHHLPLMIGISSPILLVIPIRYFFVRHVQFFQQGNNSGDESTRSGSLVEEEPLPFDFGQPHMKNFVPLRGVHKDLMTGEIITSHPTIYCPKKLKKIQNSIRGYPSALSRSFGQPKEISRRSVPTDRGEKRALDESGGLAERFVQLNTKTLFRSSSPIQVPEELRIFRLLTQPKNCQRKAYEKESR